MLRFRFALWRIWRPWLHWWPFRLIRGWKHRHQKAVISGFAGIATKCVVIPASAPEGTFRWLPDQYIPAPIIGAAEVFEDRWLNAR